MEPTQSIWYNGELLPWHEAKVHVLTHTLHYGSGAFEGIRVYQTAKGPAIFRLPEHAERLFYSASIIKMQLPYQQAEIVKAIKETVKSNKLQQGYIRPIAFYGYGVMGIDPTGAPVDLVIACWPWGAYLEHESVNIKTSKFVRIHPNSSVTDAKLVGHYLNSMLARLELQGTNYDEALLLDVDGNVAEGSGENIFLVRDGVLYTPKLGNILPGITRDTIIKLAKELGYKVIETDLKLADVYKADEAFFTGTAAEVTPIRSVDDHVLGEGKLGPITQKIRDTYKKIVRGELKEYEHYLSYV